MTQDNMTTVNTVEEPTPNGHPSAEETTSSAPAPTPIKKIGPRMPKTVQWMDLPPPYEGMKVRVWVNFPNKLARDITSGENDKVNQAVRQIFVEHNDWEDPDGNPLPPTSDDGFWDEIPNELAATMVTLLDLEGQKLPNSVRQSAQR